MIPDSVQTDLAADLLDGVDVLEHGAGPVVALAHGAGGGVEENFAPLFDEEHRWVGPYYPGGGRTPRSSTPLELERLADQVVAAAVRAGGTRFPVVGLSLGAAVAVTAAVRHPEHVSALVLTCGLARTDVQSATFSTVGRTLDADGRIETLADHVLWSCFTADVIGALSERERDEARQEFVRTYRSASTDHTELAGRVDVTGLLSQVDVPTLVVVGVQDRVVLPSTARSFTAIRGAELVEYDDAGHIFMPDQAARWAVDVHTFLDSVDSVDRR